MEMYMPSIIGNEKLRKRLCHEISQKTLSHAYIISGQEGSGKYSIALLCAAAIACENKGSMHHPVPCLKCPSCRKIIEGKSPDIITIEKNGASVKVEQIRELQRSVSVSPNELEFKTYIIKDTQTMTAQAQNALLLTLEEPPPFIMFFLLCTDEGKLLETVKSRAPIFRTEPIDPEKLRKHLVAISNDARRLDEADKNQLDAIVSIAGGSVGKALSLLDEKTREPYVKQREAARLIVEHALAKRSVELVEAIVSLPTKQDELFPILTYAESAVRDLILLKKSEDAVLCFYSDRESAAEMAYSKSMSAMLKLYDSISKTKELLQRNANIKLTLTSFLANIQ